MLIVRSRFLYDTHDLVHSLSVEIIFHDFNFLNWCAHSFRSFDRMFEMARGCTVTKGIWFVAWSQSVRMPHQWP